MVSRFFVYLSIGIKILFLLSIGLCFHFVLKMFVRDLFQCLIYLSIGRHFLKYLCSLSIGINMHFIDTSFNWYHIWLYPLLTLFFVLDKMGKNILFCILSPLCWWLTKRGRRIWDYMHVLYMHVLYTCFMFMKRRNNLIYFY